MALFTPTDVRVREMYQVPATAAPSKAKRRLHRARERSDTGKVPPCLSRHRRIRSQAGATAT